MADTNTYVIKPGDTLSGIAAKYGIADYNTIAQANGIVNPNLIKAGATLSIPMVTKPGATSAPKTTATPAAAPVATSQPVNNPAQTQQPVQNAGGGPQTVQDLISMGYYGYQGWNDNTAAINDFKATGGAGKGGPTGGAGGMAGLGATAPRIDINAITQSAYNTPEIQAANAAITERQQALAKASAEIDDNPFYSEATRVGKQAKLTDRANNDIKVQQDILAGLKADAAVKVNAAMGQYNIDEQAYKDTISLFSTLVSQGALDNASGADLANLSIQTGIPTSMIQSIQKTSQAKNNPLKVMTTEDGTGQYVLAINDNGTIAYKTKVGDAKPTGGSGAKAGSTQAVAEAAKVMTPAITAVLNSYGNISPQDWQQAKAAWLSQGLPLKDFVDYYGSYADTNRGDFLQAYGFSNPKNKEKETL